MRFLYPFLIFTVVGVVGGMLYERYNGDGSANERLGKGAYWGLLIGAAVGVYAGLGGVF